MENSECWVVRELKVLTTRNEGEDRKSWIKPLLIIFSLEQVHEKQNLETPEMAKKTLYSARQATFSSPQICLEVQKPY